MPGSGFVMPATQTLLSLVDPFNTPDWTDISALNQAWSGRVRGRDHELDQFEAGNPTLTLNNQDGRFSRWNTNSPYWNLLSGPDADCQNVSTQPNPQPYGPVISVAANGQTTVPIGLPANSGGYLVALAVIIKSGTITVSSVTGPTGLTWASLGGVTDATDAARVEIWSAYVTTNAAILGNITVAYSGSVTAVNCELSYQRFTGAGSFTPWTFQTSASQNTTAFDIVEFPTLTSVTPSVYFGAAYALGTATTTPAGGSSVNGVAPTVTANANLVVYNPSLVGTQAAVAWSQSSTHQQALAVMLSPNGFSWTAGTNCSVAPVLLPAALWTGNQTNGTGNTGPYGLQVKATGSGTMTAATVAGIKAYPVAASTSYLSLISVAPASTTRNVSVLVSWYNSSGTLISTSTSSAVAETASVWTKVSQTVTSPATAAYAAVGVSVASAVANEIHYTQRAGISKAATQGPANTAWAPGQRSMVPTRSVWIKPTWSSTPYETFQGYVDSFLPVYGDVRSTMTVQCSDKMALLAAANMDSSMYAQQVLLDGATGFWRCADLGTPVVLADSSGNGHSATVSGVVTGGFPGPVVTDPADGACSFDGGGYASTSGFGPTGTVWSIEAWFQMPNTATNGIIWDQGSTTGHSGPRIQISSSVLDVSLFNSAGTDEIALSFATTPNDGNWHQIIMTSNGTAWTAVLDNGTETHSGTLGTAVSVSNTNSSISGTGFTFFQGNLADVSVYATALTGTQISNHYELAAAGSFSGFTGTIIESVLLNGGWPSSSMNIANGIGDIEPPSSGSLTSTNLLSYIQSVEQAEQGAFYIDGSGNFVFRNRWYTSQNTLATSSQATLANDTNGSHFQFMKGSIVAASDNLDIWNDTIGQTQANGSLPQISQDPASIARFGRRSQTGYTSLPYDNDSSAAGEANVLTAAYAEPVPRIRQISLDNVANAGANLPIMLGFDLLTRITIIWQPFDGTASPLTQDYLIEGITHKVEQGHWVTTWNLSIPYTWLTWSQ